MAVPAGVWSKFNLSAFHDDDVVSGALQVIKHLVEVTKFDTVINHDRTVLLWKSITSLVCCNRS